MFAGGSTHIPLLLVDRREQLRDSSQIQWATSASCSLSAHPSLPRVRWSFENLGDSVAASTLLSCSLLSDITSYHRVTDSFKHGALTFENACSPLINSANKRFFLCRCVEWNPRDQSHCQARSSLANAEKTKHRDPVKEPQRPDFFMSLGDCRKMWLWFAIRISLSRETDSIQLTSHWVRAQLTCIDIPYSCVII